MSVQKAVDTLNNVSGIIGGELKTANPDPTKDYICELKYDGQNLTEEDVYFPVPVTIIVHEE